MRIFANFQSGLRKCQSRSRCPLNLLRILTILNRRFWAEQDSGRRDYRRFSSCLLYIQSSRSCKNPQNPRNNLIFKTARRDINRRVSINHGALWAKKGREKGRVSPSPVGDSNALTPGTGAEGAFGYRKDLWEEDRGGRAGE